MLKTGSKKIVVNTDSYGPTEMPLKQLSDEAQKASQKAWREEPESVEAHTRAWELNARAMHSAEEAGDLDLAHHHKQQAAGHERRGDLLEARAEEAGREKRRWGPLKVPGAF